MNNLIISIMALVILAMSVMLSYENQPEQVQVQQARTHIVEVPCLQTNEVDGEEICTVYLLSDGQEHATQMAEGSSLTLRFYRAK